ncbi:MAG TPA: Gfo/Idh/MocA family oxidoreductase [Thermoflexales bacterium]|nr:Gfo/Idh/MocA family oxidoreductase [Thermoflexales bacterium]HRA55496.1 Gfo/Idh/MocA family oxidoreductase [Thermoflexales bacterium]
MADTVGFLTMADAVAHTDAPEIGVGMLGYAFMGKAHANALKKLPYMIYPPPAVPKLAAIAGRSEAKVREAARRYGFAKAYTDWRAMLDDPEVQVFDNAGPNDLHAEPNIAAAQAGKHVISEKPLGRNAEECKLMWEAVKKARVKHQVAFNYRFVPAVRLIRNLIDAGKLGRIYHFRAAYLQEWIASEDFPMVWRLESKHAGSGALGDLGSHVVDLARYLVGEPKSLMARTETFIKQRKDARGKMQKVDVDDAFQAIVEYRNGAVGTLEASRFCPGRKNSNTFEINAEKGSVRFNLEAMNELEVFWKDGERDTQGFTKVLVSESYHPFWSHWWPQGHIIGWEHTFVHEFAHFFEAIVNKTKVAPHAADFEDGYKNAVICDAILASARERKQVDIKY